MFFRDLTPYEYGRAKPEPNVLNIGWLSVEHVFRQNVPDERLVRALSRLIASPVNLYRGSHLCEFCPPPPTVLSKGEIPMLNPEPGTTGNGEIHVANSDGTTFIAPVLILHYITKHCYEPPQIFIDAVLGL